MAVNLEKLGIDEPRWAAFVAASDDALPYHHPAWAALLSECYGYHAFVVAACDDAGSVRAALPVMEVKIPLKRRKWVSLPFTDFCPPLAVAASARAEFERALETELSSAGIGRWEIRATVDATPATKAPQGYWHELELGPDVDAVFRTFKKKQVQQPIGKAEREGLSVRVADDERDLTEVFYRLHLATRRRLGVPIQPRRFFRLFWRRIVEPGLGLCLIVESRGRPVAAAVFLEANGKTTYKYSASDTEYLKLRPNNLLLWHAIKRSAESGGRSFDFGRTDLANEGLRTFKNGWGTVEHELSYTTFGPAGDAVAGESPWPLTTIIRQSPVWVCRAIGEIAYKYAA